MLSLSLFFFSLNSALLLFRPQDDPTKVCGVLFEWDCMEFVALSFPKAEDTYSYKKHPADKNRFVCLFVYRNVVLVLDGSVVDHLFCID